MSALLRMARSPMAVGRAKRRMAYLLLTPTRVRAYSSWAKRQDVIDRATHWCGRVGGWPMGWELLNAEVR